MYIKPVEHLKNSKEGDGHTHANKRVQSRCPGTGGLDGNGQIDVIGAWRSAFPPTLYLLVLFEPLSVKKHNKKAFFPPKVLIF